MEKALRYEIETNIPALSGNVYPTNAPEGVTKPYLVYVRSDTDKERTLEGYTGKQAINYMFSVMAANYADMKTAYAAVESMLEAMARTSIGETNNIYVEDLVINDMTETYEYELKAHRGIIDFTIYF